LARVEDFRLLTGRGQYIHDISLPGVLHAVFVRSMYPSGRIQGLDLAAARASEGVVAVLGAEQLCGRTMPAINPLVPYTQTEDVPLLPEARVTSVGQPVALVVAHTLRAAHAAAELVFLDVAPETARADHTAGGAPVADLHFQSASQPVAEAAHKVSMVHHQPRVTAMPLEPRAALAQWEEAAQMLTIWLPSQAPARARADVARTLGLPVEQVRVIAPDVGGSFGSKASVCPEDLVLAFAAWHLRANIKWTATRSEEFMSAAQGRGAHMRGSLSLDTQGRFIELRASFQFPLGSWLPFSAVAPMRNAARILPGPYRVGSVDIRSTANVADAAAVNIYRGAGRPEAALLMEHLVERAARASGIDPVDLRERNLLHVSDLPYTTPTGESLDSGDYRAALTRACARFGYAQERQQQAGRRANGELVGIGLAVYIEPCGQGWESARVTLQADGRVVVASGSVAQGQGHETSYATIAAEVLGCAPELVTVQHGDTAACPPGIGSLASRSIAIGGSAVVQAARQALERREAGEALPIVEAVIYTAPGEAWSYGCVIARMAIDRDTGEPKIERLVWVDDAGRIVSPQLAEGQLLGGLAQGLGQAMLERIVYDETGQLLSGSLMDYAVPRADNMPEVELESMHIPSTVNLLGAKGVGEAGCIGVPAALLNAAADALSPYGEPDLHFPLTAEQLWRAMKNHS
jgi:carbon-monoxide dehydrogenase large subunit